jgi:hypothetical protein
VFDILRIGERLAAVERLVRKLDDAGHARAAAVDTRIEQLSERIAQQPTAKDLRELRQAVRAMASRDDRQTLDEIGRIVASGRPIVVGPWTGELGFELLYWIPFVAWVQRQWNVPRERLFVISRGGVASWYGVDQTRYADVFSFIGPDEFRQAVGEEKRKQRRVTGLDERLVTAVRDRHGLAESELLHPGVMYRLFAPFWNDEAGYARIEQFTRYESEVWPDRSRRDKEQPDQASLSLPPDYVAVRFYFSECFPDTAENRGFVQGAVLSLAERQPVVLLNPGFSVDEHDDWTASAAKGVHTLAGRLHPPSNLGVQAAVIRGARAFVGTYGGYSYLAPLCGVPATVFFSRRTFKEHHLFAAQRAFAQAGAAALTVVDVSAAPLVQSALAALAAVHS